MLYFDIQLISYSPFAGRRSSTGVTSNTASSNAVRGNARQSCDVSSAADRLLPVVTQLRQYHEQQEQRSPIDNTSDIARRRSVPENNGGVSSSFETLKSDRQGPAQFGTAVRQSWTPSQSSVDSELSRSSNQPTIIRQTTAGLSAGSVSDDRSPSVNDVVERFNGESQQFSGQDVDSKNPSSQINLTSYDINFNVKGSYSANEDDRGSSSVSRGHWPAAMTSRTTADASSNGFRRETTNRPTNGGYTRKFVNSSGEGCNVMPDDGHKDACRQVTKCVYMIN
jgi:hypothetical protein